VAGHWPTGHQFDTCVLQHAAAQQCLSKASNTFTLTKKEKSSIRMVSLPAKHLPQL